MLGYTMVNVIFKNSPVQLGFTFKGYKAAEDLLAGLAGGGVGWKDIEDDFGCKASVNLTDIASVVLNEIDREIGRQIETKIEQDLEYSKRMRAEQGKPANQIMMPAGSPIIANA